MAYYRFTLPYYMGFVFISFPIIYKSIILLYIIQNIQLPTSYREAILFNVRFPQLDIIYIISAILMQKQY